MSHFVSDGLHIDIVQECYIRQFRSQIKENEHSHLTGNILILSDRLLMLASELYSYMEHHTDANMLGVISNACQLETIPNKNIDYLIIVGYLEKKQSYNIANVIRFRNKDVKTIQWAIIDPHIISLGQRHHIPFQFDRARPASEFVKYLDNIKECRDYDMGYTFI